MKDAEVNPINAKHIVAFIAIIMLAVVVLRSCTFIVSNSPKVS